MSRIAVISSLPMVTFTLGHSCSLSSAINSVYLSSSLNFKSLSSELSSSKILGMLKFSTRFLLSSSFISHLISNGWY